MLRLILSVEITLHLKLSWPLKRSIPNKKYLFVNITLYLKLWEALKTILTPLKINSQPKIFVSQYHLIFEALRGLENYRDPFKDQFPTKNSCFSISPYIWSSERHDEIFESQQWALLVGNHSDDHVAAEVLLRHLCPMMNQWNSRWLNIFQGEVLIWYPVTEYILKTHKSADSTFQPQIICGKSE